MQTGARPLLDRLDAADIPYELIKHLRTDTAAAEADALGVEPSQVAKTIVLTTPAGFVLAVIPASQRLDMHKVRAFLETKDVELATEEVLAGAYPEFELGAVPPLATAHGDRVIVDVGVRAEESVLIEAGTHEESLKLMSADLIRLNGASIADLCCD
jgi:Ala-tRNA(Pro) deacylase